MNQRFRIWDSPHRLHLSLTRGGQGLWAPDMVWLSHPGLWAEGEDPGKAHLRWLELKLTCLQGPDRPEPVGGDLGGEEQGRSEDAESGFILRTLAWVTSSREPLSIPLAHADSHLP